MMNITVKNDDRSAEKAYYRQEANGGFIGWTHEGMEFLYRYKSRLLSTAHKTLLRRMLCIETKR